VTRSPVYVHHVRAIKNLKITCTNSCGTEDLNTEHGRDTVLVHFARTAGKMNGWKPSTVLTQLSSAQAALAAHLRLRRLPESYELATLKRRLRLAAAATRAIATRPTLRSILRFVRSPGTDVTKMFLAAAVITTQRLGNLYDTKTTRLARAGPEYVEWEYTTIHKTADRILSLQNRVRLHRRRMSSLIAFLRDNPRPFAKYRDRIRRTLREKRWGSRACRRAALQRLQDMGWPDVDIMKMSLHTSESTLRRYLRFPNLGATQREALSL
jgi:hypothetical protein